MSEMVQMWSELKSEVKLFEHIYEDCRKTLFGRHFSFIFAYSLVNNITITPSITEKIIIITTHLNKKNSLILIAVVIE